MGDVGERSCMYERRTALQRLHQVRLDRVAHHDRHRARDTKILQRHRLALEGLGNDHPANPGTEVVEIVRKGKDRHDLGRGRDVELRLAHVARLAEANQDTPQRTIVHIKHPRPPDRQRIDLESIATEKVVVQEGGAKIVRSGNGMEIAGEMEVHILHRHNLAVASACSAALDTEDRPQ